MSHLLFDAHGVSCASLINAKDSFIFSTSEDEDRERFLAAGYDAIYSINSYEFFSEIESVLSSEFDIFALIISKMIYDSNSSLIEEVERRLKLNFDEDNALPPAALLKDPSQEYQREVRAYFETRDDYNANGYPIIEGIAEIDVNSHRKLISKLFPVNIEVPNARKYATAVWNCGNA